MPIIVRLPLPLWHVWESQHRKGPSISGVPFVHKYLSSSQTPCYVEPDTWLALQTIASNPYLASPFLPIMLTMSHDDSDVQRKKTTCSLWSRRNYSTAVS